VVTPTNKEVKIGQVEVTALLYSKYLVYLSLSRSNVTAVIDVLILNLKFEQLIVAYVKRF